MRMLRRAPGWGLVSRKPQQAPSGWGEGAVHGTEPAPSFLKSGVLRHYHPFCRTRNWGEGMRTEGAGSRPGLRPRTGPRWGP